MWDWDELEAAEQQKSASTAEFPGAGWDEVTDVPVPEGHDLRVFLISDIHADQAANRAWLEGCLQNLQTREGGFPYFNCLLLPGDVCDGEERFQEVMSMVASRFDAVCFCFGNHELWLRAPRKGSPPPASSSLEKLERINQLCQGLKVYTSPVRFLQRGGKHLILLPLWSWYHSGWDTEPDLPAELQPPLDPKDRYLDYRLCRWGDLEQRSDFRFGGALTSPVLAEHFAGRNTAWIEAVEQLVEREGGEVLTFSHFCPRQELVLEKHNTYDQHLPRISGSAALEKQIRRVRPVCHAFGHTHVPWDAALDGVRYVQWALGNVRERQGQTCSVNQGGMLLLYEAGQWSPLQFQHWAYYYAHMGKRTPGSTELAPWVTSGYASQYPEMVPTLRARGLLRDPHPDHGYAAHFPGGVENNGQIFWARHETENRRWRCPASKSEPQQFPCGSRACLLCAFNEEQGRKPSAWWLTEPS